MLGSPPSQSIEINPEDLEDINLSMSMPPTQVLKSQKPGINFNHKNKLTQNADVEEQIEMSDDEHTDPGMINLLSQQNQENMKA